MVGDWQKWRNVVTVPNVKGLRGQYVRMIVPDYIYNKILAICPAIWPPVYIIHVTFVET